MKALIFFSLILILLSCSKFQDKDVYFNESKFVGTWVSTIDVVQNIFEFNADNTGRYTIKPMLFDSVYNYTTTWWIDVVEDKCTLNIKYDGVILEINVSRITDRYIFNENLTIFKRI